jgi:hypothetical protein
MGGFWRMLNRGSEFEHFLILYCPAAQRRGNKIIKEAFGE